MPEAVIGIDLYKALADEKSQRIQVLLDENERLRRELSTIRSGVWGYLAMFRDRPDQAESLLRSCLPDDYRPVGA